MVRILNFVSRSQLLLKLMLLLYCTLVESHFAMSYPMQQQYPCPQPMGRPPLIPPPQAPPPMPYPPRPWPGTMGQNMMALPAGYAIVLPNGFGNGGQKRFTTTTTTKTTTTSTTPRPRPMIIPIQMMPPPMMPPPMFPGLPMMMPGPPMMMPSPIMLLNYPRNSRKRRRKLNGHKSSSSASTSSSSSASSETDSCGNNRGNSCLRSPRSRQNIETRRSNGRAYSRVPEVGVVKPVLSYVGPNGDVKFETKITNREAVSLLNDRDTSIEFENDSLNHHEGPRSNVKVLTKRDKSNEKLIVYTAEEPQNPRVYTRRSFHRVTMGKKVQQYLHKGKKELIFNAPENKKITNMSLSFQVV